MAVKPKFNPNQSFEVAATSATKPKFNPNQAFEEASSADSDEPGPQESPGLLGTAVDYGLKGFDYLGGLGRVSAQTMYDLQKARHEKNPQFQVTKDDIVNAFKGNAPTNAEFMERRGVPEGPRFNLSPMEGDTSLRDIVGFGADMVTDPLTHGVFKGSRAAGDAVKNLGERTYKSGFKKIDERLAEQGKRPISDVLLESGAPTGTTKKLSGDMRQVAKDALDERSSLYQRATDKGATVDLNYPLSQAESYLSKARKKPGIRQKLEPLEALLSDYKLEGRVDLPTLSEWKSDLYKALPDSAFGIDGKPRGIYAEFEKALSSDFRQAIIDAGEKAEPGLGKKIDKLNETLGSVISAKKPTKIQIRRGETPNLVTSVDAMMAGLGGGAAIPFKKGADVAKTTYARTKAGKGLINLGESGLVDPALRRGLIDSNRRKNDKRN